MRISLYGGWRRSLVILFLGRTLNDQKMRGPVPSHRVVVLSRVALFSTLYVVLSFIPLSPFIGASSLLTVNIVMIPVFAILLPLEQATLSALLGSLISLYVFPQGAIFGPATMLLPLSGAIFGNFVAQKPRLVPATIIFIAATIAVYLIERPQFPFWIAPHILAIALAIISIFYKKIAFRVPAFAFVATMSQLGMMHLLSIFVLALPWAVFALAFPFMIFERTFATVGGSILVLALRKRLPNQFVAA